MSHQVKWNSAILEAFIKEACLTETEEVIIRTRVRGYTITQQAYMLHMSESNVKKIIARLKKKYDNAQKVSNILPKRRS